MPDSQVAALQQALKAVTALVTDEIQPADLVSLILALTEELELDHQSQFAVGQELIGRAFAHASQIEQTVRAPTLGEIESAQARRLSPKDRTAAHMPVEQRSDWDGQQGQQSYVDHARRYIPGLDEREDTLGGYVSIADLSRRRSEQTGKWAVYNGPALGILHTSDQSSLYELVRRDRIQIQGIHGHGYDEADSVRINIFNPGSRILVRVERGTIFERRLTDAIQNLSVKDEVTAWVNTGEYELKAFGLCMDQSASAPSGQPMLLTPWVLRRNINGQDDLWAFTRLADDDDDRPATAAGKYVYTLFGEEHTAKTQKDVLTHIFQSLADDNPSFLGNLVKLYEEQKPNNVPIIARRKTSLPQTARKSSVRVGRARDQYWLNTALDKNTKLAKVEEACQVAGIEFGDSRGVDVDF